VTQKNVSFPSHFFPSFLFFFFFSNASFHSFQSSHNYIISKSFYIFGFLFCGKKTGCTAEDFFSNLLPYTWIERNRNGPSYLFYKQDKEQKKKKEKKKRTEKKVKTINNADKNRMQQRTKNKRDLRFCWGPRLSISCNFANKKLSCSPLPISLSLFCSSLFLKNISISSICGCLLSFISSFCARPPSFPSLGSTGSFSSSLASCPKREAESKT